MRKVWLGWLFVLAFAVLVSPARGQKPTEKIRVAFVANNSHYFWVIAKRGARAAAKELGDTEVVFKMPRRPLPEEQRKCIEKLLTKGVKAIAVSPNNVDSQIDFYRDANKKVPLLMVDIDVDEKKDSSALGVRRCYLGTNNVKAGEAAGQLVRQAVPDGGKLAIFVGVLDILNAQERREGVCIALAGGHDKAADGLKKVANNKYPARFGKYELVDTLVDGAAPTVCRKKAEDLLTRQPNFGCLVGLWAYNPPALLEAVKERGLAGRVALVGFDEDEETLQGIKDGHVVGTVVQNPYKFGYDSVKIMASLARGDDSILKKYNPDKNGRIWVPHRVITKKNVEEFHKELKRLKGS